MDNYKPIMIPAATYDEMGIDENTPLKFDYDADTQTLHVHVLTEDELETLAGHCADRCDECLWEDSCDDAHNCPDCPDFVQREDDW